MTLLFAICATVPLVSVLPVIHWTKEDSRLPVLSASVHPSRSLLSEAIPASSAFSSPFSSIFMQMVVEGVTVVNANQISALSHSAHVQPATSTQITFKYFCRKT